MSVRPPPHAAKLESTVEIKTRDQANAISAGWITATAEPQAPPSPPTDPATIASAIRIAAENPKLDPLRMSHRSVEPSRLPAPTSHKVDMLTETVPVPILPAQAPPSPPVSIPAGAANSDAHLISPLKSSPPSVHSRTPRLVGNVPTRLGAILITELLENDGLCLIFRAWHEGLRIPVIVKVLAEKHWDGLPEVKTQLQRDLHVLRLLSHPSMMRVWDYREEKGLSYLVMDDYDGPSIGDMMELGLRFHVNRSLEILDQIIEALWIARTHGVFHLQLSPVSLRLPKVGLARIAGLGLSALAPVRSARIADPDISRDSICCKAAPYLSPEQAEGDIGDQRSDIYSLGALIYHALTGEPPFLGVTAGAILAKAHCQVPTNPSRLNRDVDKNVADLILRMMARSPDQRFSDYDVLRIALTEVAKRRVASGQTQDISGRSSLWSRVMRLELKLPPPPAPQSAK